MEKDKNSEESAISAFFAEKVRTKFHRWIDIRSHEYDSLLDSCFIKIGPILHDTINLDFFKDEIKKTTGISNVFLHTRKKNPGFVIELKGNCRKIFLKRFSSSKSWSTVLFDFLIFLLMILGIWIIYQ